MASEVLDKLSGVFLGIICIAIILVVIYWIISEIEYHEKMKKINNLEGRYQWKK